MLKSFPICKRNGAHLIENKCLKKTRIIHFWGLSVLNLQKHFWFVSNFGHVNFVIDEKYSKKHYDNPNYYVSLVIFQTCKNVVLRSVHSLGWLLWMCFSPRKCFVFKRRKKECVDLMSSRSMVINMPNSSRNKFS